MLKVLLLNGNKIDNKGGMSFAQALQINTTLEHLDVGEADLVFENIFLYILILYSYLFHFSFAPKISTAFYLNAFRFLTQQVFCVQRWCISVNASFELWMGQAQNDVKHGRDMMASFFYFWIINYFAKV